MSPFTPDARRQSSAHPVAIRALLAAALLATAATFFLATFVALPRTSTFFHVIYPGLYLIPAGACLARGAMVRSERRAWLLMGAGMLGSAAGWAYYHAVVNPAAPPHDPSVADALRLSFYVTSYVGVALLLRSRLRAQRAALWLDAVIAASALAAVGGAVVVRPILDAHAGDLDALIVGLAYPVGDFVVLGAVLAAFALTGWRPGRDWAIIGGAFGTQVIADLVYLKQSAAGTFEAGSLLDAIWLGVAAAVACVAWQRRTRTAPVVVETRLTFLTPIAFGGVGAGVLIWGNFARLDAGVAGLAALSLAASLVRAMITLREKHRLESLAREDSLTGLLNHREFHAAVERELDLARRRRSHFSVVLFDLDGFKAVNDTRGHAEGDRVLRDVAAIARKVSRAVDIAGRIGGDEFALLMPHTTTADAFRVGSRIQRAIESLDVGISASFGVAEWPEDGPNKDMLMLRADVGLYAAKPGSDRGRLDAVATVLRPRNDPEEARPAHPVSRAKAIERILAIARRQLQMDIAYFSEFTSGHQVFRGMAGEGDSFGLVVGEGIALEDSYCQRLVDGEIPNAIPDTSANPRVASLQVTAEADLGAYVGVPLRLSSGRLYGTLCCASHAATPSLGERDVSFLRVLGRLIADQLEQQELAAENERLKVQATGVEALLAALDARDNYTGEHSKAVVELSAAVAHELRLEDSVVADVKNVALLHDIGKLGIADAILNKRGTLTIEEWGEMRRHPEIGAQIVAEVEGLRRLAPLIRAEHERWDGGGYPDGLRGDAVPVESRIVFACDSFHAMTSDRPYRRAMPVTIALGELRANAGAQFDPTVVEALVTILQAREAVADPMLGTLMAGVPSVSGGVA